eukprot:2510814-Amphidinium_carterae.3
MFQQTVIELGPFFARGSGVGELHNMTEFNQIWIERSMSKEGQRHTNEYLEIWNSWTETSVQGRPIAPIGDVAADYEEQDRYKMFYNESGSVPKQCPIGGS